MKRSFTLASALVALAAFAAPAIAQQKDKQKNEPAPPSQAQPQTGERIRGIIQDPCDKWFPGTIWDPSQCDQLLRFGQVVKDGKIFTTPGATLKFRIEGKEATPVKRASLEGYEVVVVSRHDKSVVARTQTGKDGSCRFTIPSNVTGELQLQVHQAHGLVELPFHSFQYCYLQPDVNVVTLMCVDDPVLVCEKRPLPPSQAQKVCLEASTLLQNRLRDVEGCDKAEKEGRVKEAKNCRHVLTSVPIPFRFDKNARATSDSACAGSPGNGPVGLVYCWSGVADGCGWAICHSGSWWCWANCDGNGCVSE